MRDTLLADGDDIVLLWDGNGSKTLCLRDAEREMFLASVGQLVGDGKMVLAERTIPVDHPSRDLAYAGPPQPPQPDQGPANPYPMRASVRMATRTRRPARPARVAGRARPWR